MFVSIFTDVLLWCANESFDLVSLDYNDHIRTLQPLAESSTAVATTGITDKNRDPDVQIAIKTESTMASGNKNSDITADLVNASELTSTPKIQKPV